MTVRPLFIAAKNSMGSCCCTTCCDFEAGALLCSYSHFVFSLGFYVYTPYIFLPISSFICIYSIQYIFFYIYGLYSWEWCDYVIKSNYVNADLFLPKKKLCSHFQWEKNCNNLGHFVSV